MDLKCIHVGYTTSLLRWISRNYQMAGTLFSSSSTTKTRNGLKFWQIYLLNRENLKIVRRPLSDNYVVLWVWYSSDDPYLCFCDWLVLVFITFSNKNIIGPHVIHGTKKNVSCSPTIQERKEKKYRVSRKKRKPPCHVHRIAAIAFTQK